MSDAATVPLRSRACQRASRSSLRHLRLGCRWWIIRHRHTHCIRPRYYLGGSDCEPRLRNPWYVPSGAATLGSGVPNSRTRVQDWKSFVPPGRESFEAVQSDRAHPDLPWTLPADVQAGHTNPKKPNLRYALVRGGPPGNRLIPRRFCLLLPLQAPSTENPDVARRISIPSRTSLSGTRRKACGGVGTRVRFPSV